MPEPVFEATVTYFAKADSWYRFLVGHEYGLKQKPI